MSDPAKISPLMRRNLILLLVLSAALRSFLAGLLELGNDEVYYFTYALYPDLSYFDHPPMVGFLIRLSTFNLHFTQEFFVRLGAVLAGTVNTWLLFRIGRMLKDEITGWYSALLYTASIYGFVIAGVFILPDAPQSVFWLISLYLLLQALPDKELSGLNRKRLLLAGISIGFAMLSKYTSAFLATGSVAYVLLFNRNWLRAKEFYLAIFIALIAFSPVIVWNAFNHFISFGYQGGRAGIFSEGLKPVYFLKELGGQILYNNPVNVALIVIALLTILRRKVLADESHLRIILLISLPLIVTFLFIALFRQTLPHWTGMAWVTLLPIAALQLRATKSEKCRIPLPLAVSLGLLLLVTIAGTFQVYSGWIKFYNSRSEMQGTGHNDPSLDMFGWRQLREKMPAIVERDQRAGVMAPEAVFVSFRWFPLANIDYYIARPLHMKVLGIGKMEDIHHYAWINEKRGGFRQNMDAYYITSGRDYKDPLPLYKSCFKFIEPCDTIPVVRNGKTAMYFFIYRLHNLQVLPDKYPLWSTIPKTDAD
jgi:4-amino-4-deoxy-L-arabinose transferase-like glycosyltransferase